MPRAISHPDKHGVCVTLYAYDTLVSTTITQRSGPEIFLTYSDTRPVNQNKHLSIIDERGLLPIFFFFFLQHSKGWAWTGLKAMSELKEKKVLVTKILHYKVQ